MHCNIGSLFPWLHRVGCGVWTVVVLQVLVWPWYVLVLPIV